MDGRRRKTVHAARRPEERPKDASHSSTFTECTAAMLTLPSFAGPTSARSVTRTVRMRFSVGTGHRQANAALHRAVIVRMRFHTPTLNYVERRTAEGRPKREIIRCLKRFLAREIFQRVMADYRARQAADLAA